MTIGFLVGFILGMALAYFFQRDLMNHAMEFNKRSKEMFEECKDNYNNFIAEMNSIKDKRKQLLERLKNENFSKE
jgi:uncharacterized membrane-anchored protein YhcB (DUF1043 family)